MHKFICGCQVPTRDRLKGDPELSSLDTVTWDSEGFLNCSVHHSRLYGWRIPSHSTLPIGMAGCSELEWQAWVLYGDLPPQPEIKSMNLISTVASQRDNRDPVEDFKSIAHDVQQDRLKHDDDDFKSNGNGNGKGVVVSNYGFGGGKQFIIPGPTEKLDGNEQMRRQRELAQQYQDATK